MKLRLPTAFLCASTLAFLTGCASLPPPPNRAPRANAVATITYVEHMEDGKYAYVVTFPTPDSIALDQDGAPITHVKTTRHNVKAPLLSQSLRVRYLRAEPSDFKILDPIRFEAAVPATP